LLAGRIVQLDEVESEKSSGNQELGEPGHWPRQTNDGGENDCSAKERDGQLEEVGEQDAGDGGEGDPREWLPAGDCELHRTIR
jgi:hypothetical protein